MVYTHNTETQDKLNNTNAIAQHIRHRVNTIYKKTTRTQQQINIKKTTKQTQLQQTYKQKKYKHNTQTNTNNKTSTTTQEQSHYKADTYYTQCTHIILTHTTHNTRYNQP